MNYLKLRRLLHLLLAVAGCAAGLLPLKAAAQADIHFSQFYETSILRNPALTGVFANDYKFGAYYRSQWTTISNPYVTALFSAETRVAVGRMGNDFVSFGLLGYTDKAGSIDQKITAIYPAINYNKSLNADHNTYLSFGFTGGYVQYSFDPSKATFNNQYLNGHFNAANPSLENLPNAKMTMWDIGTGINFNTSAGSNNDVTYVLGASAYHITQPQFSYYQTTNDVNENIRWNVNAGVSFNINESFLLQLQGNYALQGAYEEIMAGGLLNWTRPATLSSDPGFGLSGGVFLRYGDAIIPVMKLKYKNMAVGVSYDVNISPLKEASNMQGGFEFTLFLTGDYGNKSGMVKKTVCPKF